MTYKLAQHEAALLADIIALLDHRNLGIHITDMQEAKSAVWHIGEVAIAQRSLTDAEMMLIGKLPAPNSRALEVDEDRYQWMALEDINAEDVVQQVETFRQNVAIELLAHYSQITDAPVQA